MSQPAATAHQEAPALLSDDDDVVLLRGVSWGDFQRLLEIRGDAPVPRFAYLEGVLEIMSPSRQHESVKSMIGRLVEAWCLARDVGITPYGSWTLEDKEVERGVEPDECYVLGEDSEPDRPDLAIEVIRTSGGLNKLDIYRRLRVKEVWLWKGGRITIHVLRGERYEPVEGSEVLPGIDLDQLLAFADIRPMTRAVRAYTEALSERDGPG